MTVEPDSFTEFYREVWSYEPFGWQRDLVDQVHAEGRWPDLIDLPTGTGKTSTIDIALFLLACDAGRPTTERRMSRRVVTVVDRRVVVDQAHERAEELLSRLQTAVPGSVSAAVADALRGTWGGGAEQPPFRTSVLRGGIVRDEAWARRPDVPAVLASTVDQVGSRLLFRGYGISARMAPVHAGLLGTDTLLLLDEVHLSQAFAETLRRLEEQRPTSRWPARWGVVELSATPGRAAARTFPASPLDPTSSPVLERRLRAAKPVNLQLVKGRDRGVLALACADATRKLLAHRHVRTLAVVVNRVQTAAAVARGLEASEDGPEVVVLTGRVRPLDRDETMRTLQNRLATGRARLPDEPRLVVVATQCIEAGADFDFDGLVTECASLPALRQRFGRVDRDGVLAAARTPAPSVLLALSSEVTAGDDPVYGSALAATWTALASRETIDFGVTALAGSGLTEDAGLAAAPAQAPHLLPAHLDAWVQTQPKPTPDPDPALWLHGLEDPGTPDVSVVWRADLSQAMLSAGDVALDVGQLIAACPPVSGEAMPLPLAAVRAWLAEAPAVPVADLEGVDLAGEDIPGGRLAVRWSAEGATIVEPHRILPGDLLVVPAAYGGIDRHGNWDPAAERPVTDLGHQAQAEQRQHVVLRLAPTLWPDLPDLPMPERMEDETDRRNIVLQWLGQRRDNPYAQHCAAYRSQVRLTVVDGPRYEWTAAEGGSERWTERDGTEPYFVVSCLRPYRSGHDAGAASYDPEGDESTFLAREVELDDHLRGVERRARDLAGACGLPPDLADDLALAGRLHDLGKADPRFQIILHGGDEIAAASGRLLAKSGTSELDVALRRRVRERSGYPRGARHELMSLALIEGQPALEQRAHDWDLVRHLVASHHGWCRPFAPAVLDDAPRTVQVALDGSKLSAASNHGLERLDAGVPERFWILVRRYGAHGLAWLEALLQLADHQRSAEEQAAVADTRGG